MLKSIKNIVKLCFFKGDPADVDGSTPTLVTLFLIQVVLGSALVWATFWLTAIDSSPRTQTFYDEVVRVLGSICALLFVALCVHVVAHVRRVPQNSRQIFAAYLGVSIIITLVCLAFIVASVLMSAFFDPFLFSDLREGQIFITGTVFVVVSSVYLLSTFWKILVLGFILYKSLEIKFWHGGIVAIMLIYAPEVLLDFPRLIGYVVYAIAHVFDFGFF
ncbi:MAG: hypothetical protein OXH31_00895 [Gammaproteobacteria bacterium]|nr:hypothetical protein [Gammaproteobacteria bacterium]